MTKLYLAGLLIPLLILSISLFAGCLKQTEIIIAVPLCDCNYNPEDPQAGCWQGYACDADAACTNNGGLFDKCVPQNPVAPHQHGTSY